MKICVLGSSYDASDSAFKGLDPAASPARYLPEHSWHHAGIDKAKAVAQVRALIRQGFDVFVNLCDGAWDEDRAGIEVVQTLEQAGQAFTGASSAFYEPSREDQKRVCHYAEIGQPGHAMAETLADVDTAAAALRFPLIVKHPCSYGSIGMGRDARCTTIDELRTVVARNLAAYGGALIEEFVEGREFTVLVAEPVPGDEVPLTFTPVEFCFPPGETFKHFDLKWVEFDQMATRPVDDAELGRRLRDLSARMFAALGGVGYARCDLRMDSSGNLYMLEINPNCGIFYPPGQFGSADEILAASPGGHRAFAEHIVATALARQARLRKAWKTQFYPQRGYGMVAARDLAEGEVVVAGEERPHYLVTRRHVERSWNPLNRRWFQQYAWPLTGSVHVMWSDRAADWQPIDHSCAPNTWLQGLDLVARRPIAAGEALTMEYATFCGPEMEPFACSCGAPGCRRQIQGSDCLNPALIHPYAGHLSDFVARMHSSVSLVDDIGLDARVRIERGPRFRRLVARQALTKGTLLAVIGSAGSSRHASRYTVQVAEHEHILLDPYWLAFANHSCAPSVVFDTDRREVRLLRDLQPGEPITFFYPSTELDMAEPFACQCGERHCLGSIAGALHMPMAELSRYQLASHVQRAVRQHIL
ncbi:MAG: hypothetical protein HY902_17850 [Deltaproteobacteria bacterium]|nr:hypothetical protein [Deltaproteobacteria bacterium]